MPSTPTATLAAWTDRLRIAATSPRIRRVALGAVVLALVAVEPTLAKPPGKSFCKTALVKTGKNVLTVIQFGGPLLGAILLAGSAVVQPAARSSDKKKELKRIRNQALVWGILIAPLATTIVQFLLNNVVAGGASCGF